MDESPRIWVYVSGEKENFIPGHVLSPMCVVRVVYACDVCGVCRVGCKKFHSWPCPAFCDTTDPPPQPLSVVVVPKCALVKYQF